VAKAPPFFLSARARGGRGPHPLNADEADGGLRRSTAPAAAAETGTCPVMQSMDAPRSSYAEPGMVSLIAYGGSACGRRRETAGGWI